ncbi:MAG: HupE/UreJ family protein [candidate division NC10 bacterium]|nr:HupE/UreJ family protein [candidate division NC10 bacterium]
MREAILTALLLLHTSPLFAHPINVAYADIVVKAQEVEIALSMNLFELDLLLSLDRNLDALVDQGELDARRSGILEYLRGRIAVLAEGKELPLEAGPFRTGLGSDGKALFEGTFWFQARHPLTAFTIRCEPLTDLGPDHKTLAKITREGRIGQFVFQKGVVYGVGKKDVLGYLIQFLKLGIFHIFTGYDHILFLFGLLLVGGTLFNIVKIVTSFSLAHSLTLSLAALGAVNLPTRLIEAGIALSIVYVALENLLFKNFDKRWLVSFSFGLIHGFGFANILKEMHLPRSGLIASLFSFNIGVEVGQVVIVLLILPLLWILGRTKAYKAVVTSASAFILSLGLLWFYQRAF